MDRCPHCGKPLLIEWHDLHVGDRVRHHGTKPPDVGEVINIKENGEVVVRFDGLSHPRSVPWVGEYDRVWFVAHKDTLVRDVSEKD
jgi:hypothetical protein